MKDRSLKESLTRWTDFPAARWTVEPRATRQASRRVITLLQDVEPENPKPRDLAELYGRVGRAWRQQQSIASVGQRDLKQLPWILFYPPHDSSRWLGREGAIVWEYGRWIREGRRTRAVLALLHEFLRVYPNTLPTFEELRRLLLETVGKPRSPSPPSLRKWGQRCGEYRLLDREGGERFVDILMSRESDPREGLREAGLDGRLAHCGFLKSGIRVALPKWADLTARNGATDKLESLLEILEVDGKLRFDERVSRAEVAQGLLSPYLERKPGPETKERLQSFFLRHYGDPRLPSTKHKWSSVPNDLTRVVLRWLVERVLEQFFMLLKETALDRHWRYREAFWRAFLDAGYIDDIWFVLGRRAAAYLRQMDTDEDVAETTGELRGAQSDQSVLILRMPGVTIAEWSHNGSCHLWLDGADGVPPLYQRRYSARQVRRPFPYRQVGEAHSQRHQGSEMGRWQDEIVRWLRANTGVDLSRDAYFPQHLREHRPSRRRSYRRW